mmetsp:Transcript_85780/g.154480  ORF Transcript_85780/g.154480 Transcript_85780/m.154480 type:complete len:254 (+) Transcript_85780:639-1400(+)
MADLVVLPLEVHHVRALLRRHTSFGSRVRLEPFLRDRLLVWDRPHNGIGSLSCRFAHQQCSPVVEEDLQQRRVDRDFHILAVNIPGDMGRIDEPCLAQRPPHRDFGIPLQQLPEGDDRQLALADILHESLDVVLPLLQLRVMANLLNHLKVEVLTDLLAALLDFSPEEVARQYLQFRPVAAVFHQVVHESLQTTIIDAAAALKINRDVLEVCGQEVGQLCQALVLQAAALHVQSDLLQLRRKVPNQNKELLVH